MGPIYGTFFREMAKSCAGIDDVTPAVFADMLNKAAYGVSALAGAKEGDKTLYDCLSPAAAAFQEAVDSSKSFSDALTEMSAAAEKGRDSTVDMVVQPDLASVHGELWMPDLLHAVLFFKALQGVLKGC